jgi:zinc transport system substrate-binding protein
MRRLCGVVATAIIVSSAGSQELNVVASIFPIADIARQVGGDFVQVSVLLPSGASPHTFEPSPGDMRMLSDADAFLAVGLGLEHWAEDLVASTVEGRSCFMVSEGIPLLGGEPPNPHVWLDPLRATMIAANIARVYASLLPARRAVIAGRERLYRAELDSLDAWISTRTRDLASRRFVAFHPAWVYFAERYGLGQVAVVEEFPGKEPSPQYLAGLVKLVRDSAVGAVFVEPQLSAQAAETLAREAGIGVAVIDPLGGEELRGRDSYVALMRWNTEAIARALGQYR